MTTPTIDLGPEAWRNDEYRLRDSNVMRADAETTKGDSKIVHLSLSRDAMIGLGTSLLRWAHSKDMENPASVAELLPIEPQNVVSNLGVYLHPRSVKVVVSHHEFGTVDAVLKR